MLCWHLETEENRLDWTFWTKIPSCPTSCLNLLWMDGWPQTMELIERRLTSSLRTWEMFSRTGLSNSLIPLAIWWNLLAMIWLIICRDWESWRDRLMEEKRNKTSQNALIDWLMIMKDRASVIRPVCLICWDWSLVFIFEGNACAMIWYDIDMTVVVICW